MNKIKKEDIIKFAIVSIVVLVSFTVSLLCELPIKKNIDRIVVSGIMFERGAVLSSQKEVYLLMEGTYFDYLINWRYTDFFEGKIIVSDTLDLSGDVIDKCIGSLIYESGNDNLIVRFIDCNLVMDSEITSGKGFSLYNPDFYQLFIHFNWGDNIAIFPSSNIDDALYACMVFSDEIGIDYKLYEGKQMPYPGWRTQEE